MLAWGSCVLLLLLLLLCLPLSVDEKKSLPRVQALNPSNATAHKPVASLVLSCVLCYVGCVVVSVVLLYEMRTQM